ncbi:hypothetical protein F2Q68_00024178 [Brassica cretica]|uniref:Uncharacterized protein n=1 Tax=Brassica cretica TaxID=69181 RepID=A0A8S9IK63_BRACR|nr:hypothetical protein F2Q68_00024178 [Brassica cretica]
MQFFNKLHVIESDWKSRPGSAIGQTRCRRPTAPFAVGLPPLSIGFHIIAFTLCYLLLVSPPCLMCLGPMKSKGLCFLRTISEARRVCDGLGSPGSTVRRRLRSDLGQIRAPRSTRSFDVSRPSKPLLRRLAPVDLF